MTLRKWHIGDKGKWKGKKMDSKAKAKGKAETKASVRKDGGKSLFLALACACATLCPPQSLAHHHCPPPPPPTVHDPHGCSLISGTIGFVGGVLSSIGLTSKPKPQVVVVNQSMGYMPIPQEAKPMANPTTTVTTVEEKGGWFSRKKTVTVTTQVVQNDQNADLVWVEGYYVERKRGNYVETSFVPGHWEKRKGTVR